MISSSLTEIITPTQPYLLPPAAAQRLDSLNRAHIDAKLHSQTAYTSFNIIDALTER
jgi:hypothetical protein